MHEVSLVGSLVEQVEEIGRRQGFSQVLEIRLSVGALSGVEPSCVEFCFPEVTRGSVLEGARLHLEKVHVRANCSACKKEVYIEDPAFLVCSFCLSRDLNISEGKDFKIVDLEVV